MSNIDTSTEALDAECANLARLLGLGALTAIGQIRALAAERDDAVQDIVRITATAIAERAEADRLAAENAKMREALEAFSPRMMNQVQADVRSCHQMRGPGASPAMRDDDRDLRIDLRKAVEKASVALAGDTP